MSQDVLLSVVVPIYNVEEYVEKCISSIVSSSYSTLEIILVDDGSKDNSGRICDEFALKDNRIMTIHKSNGGLVSARKAGVDKATGKYLMFVDGDDFIDRDLLEELVELAEREQTQFVAYSYYEIRSNARVSRPNGIPDGLYKTDVYLREITRAGSGLTFTHDVNKLFVTKKIKEIIPLVDDCVLKGEDLNITLAYLRWCDSFYVASSIDGYAYVNRSTSITHTYDKHSIEHTANYVRSSLKLCLDDQSNPRAVDWNKLIYHEAFNLIMSDCIGCAFSKYGKSGIIAIIVFFRKLVYNNVLHDFWGNGIKRKYFNSERDKFAQLLYNKNYIRALIMRLRKQVK